MSESFTHVTHGSVCLGKKPPKRSLRSLALSNYLAPRSVAYPRVKAWERPIEWGMLGNDSVGDCTIAAALHLLMGWNAVAHAVSPLCFSTEDALELYSAVTGYDPADPTTDQGAVEIDVLNYWQNVGMKGHKISGYVTLDVQNSEQLKAAIYLFGGVYIGFNVPAYIMQVPAGGSWSDKGGDKSIIGGHAVYLSGYGSGGATLVSWGTTYTFDWSFPQEFVEEAYAIVDEEWIKQSGLSPSGLDLNRLLADLKCW